MTPPNQVLPPTAETRAGEPAKDRQANPRILIVDDEPAARKLLVMLLSDASFDCISVASGEEALVALQRDPFEAVISDLRMPGISGLDLLPEIRRLHPRMACLFTTGVDDVRVGVRAMRSGADDYLVKPFQEEVVVASLQRALERKRLEQEVENYRRNLEGMVTQRTRELQEALQQVERSYQDTLEALGAAIDLRDSETGGHSRRVSGYSLEMARAMGFSGAQLKSLAMGAYLHDIGKLAIPDGILLKPGPLTPEERSLMQQHVLIGYDLVKGIPFLAEAAEIIFTHHERYDGSGYPGGLKAEVIPPGARIFAVADTLDAITSDRPYRRASPFEVGVETIRRESGRLFDPQVVNVFVNTPVRTWRAIAQHHRQIASFPSRLRLNNTVGRPLD